MQLGIPFMEGLNGTQIGVEIDNDSFYKIFCLGNTDLKIKVSCQHYLER